MQHLERGVMPAAVVVQGAGDHLFAGPKLAFQQDRAVLVRNFLHQPENILHLRAFANEMGSSRRAQGGFHRNRHRSGAAVLLNRAINDALEIVQFKRLGQVVEGSEFHCFNRRFHAAVSRDHDHLRLRVLLAALLNDLEAIHIRNAEIHDEQFGLDPFQADHAFTAGLEEGNLMAHPAADLTDQFQNGSFVINDYNFCHDRGVYKVVGKKSGFKSAGETDISKKLNTIPAFGEKYFAHTRKSTFPEMESS